MDETLDTAWAARSHQELLTELDGVERAIARSRAFHRCTDAAGRTRMHVSPDLLALAEREHLIVSELRRRGRTSRPAA